MLTDGKWESAWKGKLKNFEDTVKDKTKKSVDKFINNMTLYRSMGEKYRQLDVAFKAMEAARQKKDITSLAKTMKKFQSHILEVTASGTRLSVENRKNRDLLKKDNPWCVPVFDILDKFIDASIASAESAYADHDKDLANLKNKWSLLSNKKSRDLKELIKFKTMLKKNLLKDIKVALLWIKEQERAPSARAFNDGIKNETYNVFRYMNEYRAKCDRGSQEYRDVNQAMAPVEKWRLSKELPSSAGGDHAIVALGKLKRMLADIARWANQL